MREATPEPPVTPPQRPATQPASIQSGDTLMFQTAPVRTLAFPLPPELRHTPNTVELANTLYDGGALRELARALLMGAVVCQDAVNHVRRDDASEHIERDDLAELPV